MPNRTGSVALLIAGAPLRTMLFVSLLPGCPGCPGCLGCSVASVG